MSTGKALLAVFAGVAAGAVIGILFASARGGDTRRRISQKGDDLLDTMNRKIEENFSELNRLVGGKLGRKVEADPDMLEKMKKQPVN